MEKQYNKIISQEFIRNLWKTNQVYLHDLLHSQKPLFTIDTPPPTVSGSLHIGHLFSYTHTDIIARFMRMNGFRVFYPFGFDDNGLPTERFTEKQRNIKGYLLGRSEFRALCLEESQKASEQFKSLWITLGISADFEHTYNTISRTVQRLSQQSFLALFEKKMVYRKYEPALYCTQCRTSVAQAELDDTTKETIFYSFMFDKDPIKKTDIIISTTRPELLASCVAIMFHPSDNRYQHLEGKTLQVPFFGHKVICIADELVDPDKGSGIVMTCTFGDKTDIAWYEKHKLSYRPSIDLSGTMINHPFFEGLSINAGRKKIVEAMRTENILVEEKKITHTTGTHERCKNPVEYLLLSQWFVSILPHKQALIELGNHINWYPTFMKTRYIDWVENLSWDWCISRQRPYGIPFPVWHCNTCNSIIPASDDQLPIDPQEHQAPLCPQCNTVTIPDTDVMDTWNTSSITPYIINDVLQQLLHEKSDKNPFETNQTKQPPVSMRPQAHDIIRTWAFDTIVKGYAHDGSIPWKDIVISGHVLSTEKEKISKSKGNEHMTPERLIADFDIDALRYWAGRATLGYDCAFSVDQIKQGQRVVTKLWNAFLFAEPHLQTLQTIPAQVTINEPLNQWIIDRFQIMVQAYGTSFAIYETGSALDVLERFFWHDYCDNYIEMIKNILFNPDIYPVTTYQETIQTIHIIGLGILQRYAPFMPFVTEAIYQALFKEKMHTNSLHITDMQMTMRQIQSDNKMISIAESLITIASTVRKLKTEQKLSLKTSLKSLTIYHEKTNALFDDYIQIIKGVTQAESVLITNREKQKDAFVKKDDCYECFINIDLSKTQ